MVDREHDSNELGAAHLFVDARQLERNAPTPAHEL